MCARIEMLSGSKPGEAVIKKIKKPVQAVPSSSSNKAKLLIVSDSDSSSCSDSEKDANSRGDLAVRKNKCLKKNAKKQNTSLSPKTGGIVCKSAKLACKKKRKQDTMMACNEDLGEDEYALATRVIQQSMEREMQQVGVTTSSTDNNNNMAELLVAHHAAKELEPKSPEDTPHNFFGSVKKDEEVDYDVPTPLCHNIVSTSQILSSMAEIDLQRLASLFPFTSYDRKRFAAITIRLANPHCTCLLFGSGKLVITGSTSFHACIVASQTITEMLREVNPRESFAVASCVIQNIVAHVELKPNQQINLEALYTKFCEHSTYQKTIFPGLVLRPPEAPIVLLIFKSGRIVCTGGKSYDDIYYGFNDMFKILKNYIFEA